ncbi:hypothetical protein D6C76_05280 [Aureobasidium pullulans]|nr:hypothetical protein D6C76_05280 [Aureobasidium pullulans]
MSSNIDIDNASAAGQRDNTPSEGLTFGIELEFVALIPKKTAEKHENVPNYVRNLLSFLPTFPNSTSPTLILTLLCPSLTLLTNHPTSSPSSSILVVSALTNPSHSVTIVSILRLKFLIQFAHTDNVTWDYLPVGYWSAVETHVGIIVACAPAIRSLTGNLRNRFFPKPTSQPSYYDDSTAHSSSKRSKGTSNSRNWGSKGGAGSRLSSLSTARGDKEFVQIDEYEMDVGGGGRLKADQRSTAEGSEEGSVNRSHTPYDDIEAAPLATTAAPIGRGVNGIMVQTDFTVGRS